MPNLMLPGNPRYQPKSLEEIFGYDYLYREVAEVEIATMRTLGDVGIIPPADIALLTPDIEKALYAITTSEVQEREKKTKHDIRAWVQLAQERAPQGLRRWIHIPLTSYDALDTARSLQFLRAHKQVVRPLVKKLVGHFGARVREFASQRQIGRTHGQHALPITVGFWLATILKRLLQNAKSADDASKKLVGKISGAVGAYNAQVASGITAACSDGVLTFEERVLLKLGLRTAPISTQILPPEPTMDYLFACLKLSATLGQFGRDGRHLMRSENAELGEPFDAGQVGSSTMAHKRNPVNFENLESTWLKTKNEFGKVLDAVISEHQRDLVNSAISRDFPTIVVNLVSQLETLLRGDPPFIARIGVDAAACERNLLLQGDSILAEPVYIALQMAGYMGDAHELVNHGALKRAREMTAQSGTRVPLLAAVQEILDETDPVFAKVWKERLESMKASQFEMLTKPEKYLGLSEDKAFEVAKEAEYYVASRLA